MPSSLLVHLTNCQANPGSTSNAHVGQESINPLSKKQEGNKVEQYASPIVTTSDHTRTFTVAIKEYCTISASANTCFVDNSIQARNNPRHLLAIEEKRYAVRPPAVVELCTRGVECGAELEIGRSPDFPLAQPNCWLIANKGAMYAAEYQTDWVIFQTVNVFCVGYRSGTHFFWSPIYNRRQGQEVTPPEAVSDCTGPARAGLKWLERHGYGYSPRYPSGKLPLDQLKISFNQKLRYTSLLFKIPPGLHDRLPFPEEYKKIKPIYTFLEEDVDNGRGLFVLMRPDGDQILAFVGHHGGDIRPSPTSIGGVKEWIMNLRTVEDIPCWIFEILDVLEEIEDSAVVSVLKLAPTSYIRYHKATNLPSNFIAVGDSIMTVNPTFGEGCTKAFRGALCLHNVLRRVKTTRNTLPANFSTKFFLEQFDKIDWAWQNTRLMDYGIPTTEPLPGESLSSGSYLRWYIAQLQRLSITDDDAAWALYNSSHGTASPIDALYPRLVLKVLWWASVRYFV
ncbi:hypothetical protein B0H14DRAFT_3153977 [Mycena olivaceomarginata]|nr:hypothetical protein B0H14DRAFT_3153977 [Mycena olivaceomarginata]